MSKAEREADIAAVVAGHAAMVKDSKEALGLGREGAIYRDMIEGKIERTARIIKLLNKLAEAMEPKPADEWHEDIGPALWWCFPISEPPYSGRPRDTDFPDYVTHWTPLIVPDAPDA